MQNHVLCVGKRGARQIINMDLAVELWKKKNFIAHAARKRDAIRLVSHSVLPLCPKGCVLVFAVHKIVVSRHHVERRTATQRKTRVGELPGSAREQRWSKILKSTQPLSKFM